MSNNTILATAPLTSTNYVLKATGTTIGNSLIFDNGTNVGIGNTNTSFVLDVTGTIRATGSIYGDVGFRTKSLNGYQLKNDADSANLGGLVRRSYWAGGAALDTQIFAETGYGIYLNVNGSVTSGINITSAGYVLIGATSSIGLGSTRLQVSGTSSTAQILITNTSGGFFSTYTTSNDIYLTRTDAGSTLYIGTGPINGSAFTNQLSISSTGAATFSSTITSGGTVSVNPSSVGFLTLGASANYGSVSSGGGGATLYLNGATRGGTGGATSSCVTLATDSFFQVTDGSTNNPKMTIPAAGGVIIKQSVDNFGYELRLRNTANLDWSFINGGDNVLYLGFNGAVRGTFNPNNGIYTPSSDINKKKDFELSTIGLDAILGLKSTLYRMTDDEDNSNKHLGFIAQEVKEFIPQAYTETILGDTPFIGLDYQAITSALVKAVQEQQALITSLQSQINELKNK